MPLSQLRTGNYQIRELAETDIDRGLDFPI